MASRAQQSAVYIKRRERQKRSIKYRFTLIDPNAMTEKLERESGHLTRAGAEVTGIRIAEANPTMDLRMEIRQMIMEEEHWALYATRPAGYRSRWKRNEQLIYSMFGQGAAPPLADDPVVFTRLENDPPEPTDEDWDIL
jgi:hypothetical protein